MTGRVNGKWWRVCGALGILSLCVAQAAPAPAGPTPALSREDLSSFLDGFLPTALERGDMAGATVAVVKDGSVLLERGYGFADVTRRRAVDPDTTLFRIGSISKTFTWTALMQLAQEGRIGLDQDVNAYLDFRIPAVFGRPITPRDLLTHTAGFEEQIRNLFFPPSVPLMSLRQYVKENLPVRIFPPGSVVAYSNYGAALAGYIVERVSGEPFNEYVKRHIFSPLGMSQTSFEQPPPEQMRARVSRGYDRASDGEAQPFEMGAPFPAGSVTTSATDMARFMMAQLNDGELEGQRILEARTAQAMHTRAYSPFPSPEINGMTLGFYQEDRNGWRVVGHAGDTQWFHADLDLVLDAKVGLFIAMNSAGKEGQSDAIRFSLFRAFMDRYFPPSHANQTANVTSTALEHGQEIAGTYLPSRRIQTTLFSLSRLFGETNVSVDRDGVVRVDAARDPADVPIRWHEVAPYVWRSPDDQAVMAVARDVGGKVTALLSTDGPPVIELQPVPWYLNRTWMVPVMSAAAGVLALTLVLWPVSSLVRRAYGARTEPGARRASVLFHFACLINLIVLAAWIGLLVLSGEHITWLTDTLNPYLRLLQLGGVVALVGTVYVVAITTRSWRQPSLCAWQSLGLSAAAGACLSVSWLIVAFHLLSWSLTP
jgi:CubicO group peptidase (beta-lactamase class C family)